jgi:hypothetical protein
MEVKLKPSSKLSLFKQVTDYVDEAAQHTDITPD